MRETTCTRCGKEANIIQYCQDNPIVNCFKCGTYVMSIEEQVIRDRHIIGTDELINSMKRDAIRLQKTWYGRLWLKIKMWRGFYFSGIEKIVGKKQQSKGAKQ